jgi:hypothetical protein
MSNKSSRLAVMATLSIALAAPALATGGVEINELVVARSIPESQRDATVKAARAFYEFWKTGDEADLKRAIAPTFTDHTLPSERPQGPEGPAFASRQFRAVELQHVEGVQDRVAGFVPAMQRIEHGDTIGADHYGLAIQCKRVARAAWRPPVVNCARPLVIACWLQGRFEAASNASGRQIADSSAANQRAQRAVQRVVS